MDIEMSEKVIKKKDDKKPWEKSFKSCFMLWTVAGCGIAYQYY
jgi:hypothetical protein